MKRILFTIILVVIALLAGVYLGAYVGKEKLNEYSLIGGKKLISMTKTGCLWVKEQWQEDKQDV